MAIYKLNAEKIIELPKTTFSNEQIHEVKDLQKYIINSIDTVVEDLFVISTEFGYWEDSRRKIDILALDKNANLVVVELKRTEDGGHMELQAIRYAAMVSNMTFEKAESAYKSYLEKQKLESENPQKDILKFLGWNEINEDEFSNDVRIILVSADFSKEVTTSVLWLLERDIDIKCIRIRPQKDGSELYFDIQQIIPLPEASEYQVKLKEKAAEQRQARRESTRDYSKFSVYINGIRKTGLNKRETIYFVIDECLKSKISINLLMDITGKSKWIYVDGECDTKEDFEQRFVATGGKYDATRWFNKTEELFRLGGKTYAYNNQSGIETYDLVKKIFSEFPQLEGEIIQQIN